MKKTIIAISVVLALLMALPLATFAAKNGGLQFSDVKSGKWYYSDIQKVCDAGLMNGVSDTEFDPNGTLTRGMCATILYRAAEEPAVNGGSTFADVKAGKYYSEAVAWAENSGIVNGKTATAFDPNGNITRAEFATMLYRYLDAEDLALPATREGAPADADSVAKFAKEAVDTMYRGEVVNGRENGEFDPDDEITRAEAAAMITRLLDKVTVRWSEDYDYAWVSFTEGGYFDGVDINDITVGYVPEGLVNVDIPEEYLVDTPEFRLFILADPEEEDPVHHLTTMHYIMIVVRTDEVEGGLSDEAMALADQITINGIPAVRVHFNTQDLWEYEGDDYEWGRIIFGDKNLYVEVMYMGVDHDEAIRVAEGISATVAD